MRSAWPSACGFAMPGMLTKTCGSWLQSPESMFKLRPLWRASPNHRWQHGIPIQPAFALASGPTSALEHRCPPHARFVAADCARQGRTRRARHALFRTTRLRARDPPGVRVCGSAGARARFASVRMKCCARRAESGEVVSAPSRHDPRNRAILATRLAELPAPARLCYHGSVMRPSARTRSAPSHHSGLELRARPRRVGDGAERVRAGRRIITEPVVAEPRRAGQFGQPRRQKCARFAGSCRTERYDFPLSGSTKRALHPNRANRAAPSTSAYSNTGRVTSS